MNRKGVVTFDYYVQSILGVLILLCIIGIVINPVAAFVAAVGWFLFGSWQVLMSIIQAIAFQDKKRIKHLMFSVAYIVILILIGSIASVFRNNKDIAAVPLFLFGFFGSISLAVWCYRLTLEAKNEPENNRTENQFQYDDILDESLLND